MSDTTSAGPRAALAAERERLSNELQAIGVDRASYDEGFADSGQVTAERGEVEALAGSLRDTLNDIEDALRKIDDGTYGVCEQCGGPIGEARLEAMAAARLCITCASARR
jgi:RNA polymerase-binding transcription factor DksA